MHYWTDLQAVHRFCCCDNIAPNEKCQRVLVLDLFLVWLGLVFCFLQCYDTVDWKGILKNPVSYPQKFSSRMVGGGKQVEPADPDLWFTWKMSISKNGEVLFLLFLGS